MTPGLEGTVLDGRYRLDEKLGAGGMGAVYRGVHLLMEKPVAVKVLRADLAEDDVAAKRFQREARNASRLDDPHCVRVTDFGVTAENLRYLVMELVGGQTLTEVLADAGALPPGRAAGIAAQIAHALAHAHAQGLVHRDLKPDNVVVGERAGKDFVKVLDFGLAKLLDPENEERRTQLTAKGIVFGTPEYMAPEQATGRPVDHRADLYALGIILYQMVTGQLPFQAATVVDIMNKQVREAPPPPGVPLPPGLEALLMRLLAKAPAERPARADEVEHALGGLAVAAANQLARGRIPAAVAEHPTLDVGSVAPVAGDTEPEVALARSGRRVRVFAGVTLVALIAAGVLLIPSVETRAPAPTPAPAPVAAPPDASPPDAAFASADLAEADRFRREGNRLKELFHLQQAVRRDPQHRGARLRLAGALVDDGQPELACRTLAPLAHDAEARALAGRAGCAP